MSEPTTVPTFDKSTWGDGPWQTEPDRLEWEHAGLPCLANRNHYGAWCGYVAVPPGHPLHSKFYDDVDVSVHGGLTYASACDGAICHVPKPGEPDDVWWFGFDCNHYRDLAPAMATKQRIYDFLQSPVFGPPLVHGDIYRTLDYVQAETNHLAEQLAAADAVRLSTKEPIVSTRDE